MPTGWFRVLIAVAAGGILAAGPATAQNFYAGKTVSMTTGFPPGGGIDAEMRLISRHLPRFIPGNPTIVTLNTPGAGGIIAANALYRASPDGLSLGMPGRGSLFMAGVQTPKDPGVVYDLFKFSFIGSAGGGNWVLWLSGKHRIKSLAELKVAPKQLVIGALGPGSMTVVVPTIIAKQGYPIRVLSGYPGTSENLLALDRGETDGLYLEVTTVRAMRPEWLKAGSVVPIAQSVNELPNVAMVTDAVADPTVKTLLELYNALNRVGLAMLGPPGMPAERVALLRKALADTIADKDFIAEADSRSLPATPVSGAEIERVVHEVFGRIRPEVLAEYNALTGMR